MEFTVSFCSKQGYAVNMADDKVGLDFVDRVRMELQLNIPIERISGYICSRSYDPEITITEEQARDSGHFRNSASVQVTVPNEFINQFVTVELRTSKNGDTGEVTHVRGGLKLQEDKLFEAWREAGYPLEWGFKEDEVKED